jgi:hypothetical protein
MTLEEFSNQFDVNYNNITSNQAPGLNEYEKGVFLTKAQNEVVKNYFTANSKGNNIGQGYDDSAKRQADFSCLMKTSTCDGINASGKLLCVNADGTQSSAVAVSSITFSAVDVGTPTTSLQDMVVGTSYHITYSGGRSIISTNVGAAQLTGFPYQGGTMTREASYDSSKIDPRSVIYSFPTDVFIVINESIYTTKNTILQVVPLRYDEYLRLMSKPFKRPLKNQAWRLLNFGIGSGSSATKYAEIILHSWDTVSSYNIRYIRMPMPIILAPMDGLSIGGYLGCNSSGEAVPVGDTSSTVTQGIECELDPVLHEEILQRAVELAKVAWTATGQENVQLAIQAGQRSE